MGKLIFAVLFAVAMVGLFKVLKKMAETSAGKRGEETLARGFAIGARAVLWVGIVVPVLVVVFSTFQVITAGHVGVVTLFGKVQTGVLTEGLNVINPLYDVAVMTTQVQKHEAKYDAASKDLQAVHVQMALNYRLLPDRAAEVYQKIGVGFADTIIAPAAQEVLKANTALHDVAEILKKRAAIKVDVQDGLAKWLAKYGVELKEVSLANIGFDKDFEKAIERAQIAERDAARATWEAQAKIAEAKGKGDAAKAEAMGLADSIRIKGEAEATYNLKVATSLTPTLIQQQYLARWNGQLPQYMLGGGSGVLLQIPAAPSGGDKK